MTIEGRVPDGLLSFQGTLAVLALHLARQIHFHAPLVARPQPAEHCSWHSPLSRFLSSSWWHPHSCEFSVLKVQLGQAGSFLWARKYLWLHLRKRAISGSLHFLSKVRKRSGEVLFTLGVGHTAPKCSSVSFCHLLERKPQGLGCFRPWVWLPAQSSTS